MLGLDPGNIQSAIVRIDEHYNVLEKLLIPNQEMLTYLKEFESTDILAFEAIASYGMAVGESVFETCFWSGRFVQAWKFSTIRVYRKDVKMHLCGTMRAKDANIRQVLLDKYGGKEKAIGNIKHKGKLYGMKKDLWQALAVSITAYEIANRTALSSIQTPSGLPTA